MPVSIIDVEVSDEKFKAFVELFEKYKSAVKELPADWAKQAAPIEGISQSFIDMTSALMAQKEMFEQNRETAKREETEAAKRDRTSQQRAKAKAEAKKKVEREEKDRNKAVEKELKDKEKEETRRQAQAEKSHKKAVKDTKDIAKNIGQASLNLLKWVSIDSIVGGLLGGGALFGVDKLADHVGDLRLESNRLGITVGEKRASDLNLGGFIDASGTLENIAEAKSDLSRRWAFSALGVNPSGDPEQILAQAAPKARELFIKGGQTQQYADATGLTKLFSMGDLRSLANTDPKELQERLDQLNRDKETLNLSKDTQKEWFNLSRALKGAGATVETALIKGLSPLAPQLTQLSTVFASTITALFQNGKIQGWISDFAQGIKNVGEWLSKEDLKKDINDFATNIGLLSSKITDALALLKLIPDKGSIGKIANSTASGVGIGGVAGGALGGIIGGPGGIITGARIGAALGGAAGFYGATAGGRAGEASIMSQFDKDYRLTPGTLEAVYGLESGSGTAKGMWTPHNGGVLGPFQITEANRKHFGLSAGFRDEAFMAANMLQGYLKNYKGDMQKALAAYNWNPSALNADIKKHGSDWLKFAPAETQKYVSGGMDRIASPHKLGTLGSAAPPAFDPTEAIRSLASNLKGIESRTHTQTLRGLLSEYEGNDPDKIASALRDVTKETGYGGSQGLNLTDNKVLSKVLAALEKHNDPRSTANAGTVITILNTTGGSATASVNQLAQRK